ncbi:MAG TPA: hypothetical protein VH561_05125 [Micromonosporaceae bacterium]|jgi:hypothetical protein
MAPASLLRLKVGGALRRIGLRSSVSLALILIVVAVLVVARLAADHRRTVEPLPRPVDTVAPATDTEGNDSADDEEPNSFHDDGTVLASATGFATAWLRRDLPASEWLDGMRPYATADLIERLNAVDPLDVPPSAVIGQPTIRQRADDYAEVLVPIGVHDALALTLARSGTNWLVATVDRETG